MDSTGRWSEDDLQRTLTKDLCGGDGVVQVCQCPRDCGIER